MIQHGDAAHVAAPQNGNDHRPIFVLDIIGPEGPALPQRHEPLLKATPLQREPAERRLREAAFLLAQAQTADSRQASLRLLNTTPAPWRDGDTNNLSAVHG